MAKPVRFTPKKTAYGWRLNIPPKHSKSGKRERHFYPTQAKALEAASKLKTDRDTFGIQARAIAPSLAEQATAAEILLEPLGISLLEAVRRFVDTETRNRASETIEAAIKAFRASKPGLSDSQDQAYRLRGEKLVVAFAGRMIATITGEELNEHLQETTGGDPSFNQNLRLVRAIWRWCSKPPRKWCQLEAIEHLEARDSTSNEVGILTPEQAEAIMGAAEMFYPETIQAFAIWLFAGVRKAELERIEPNDVNADGITVSAINDRKNKRRRFIQMPEPLAAWLKKYPIVDFICPPDWERKYKAVRRHAGFAVWCDLMDPPTPPADAVRWPANALRHTAATVSVALGKPIEQLVFEHGHSGGLETLRSRYVGTMSTKDALAIWAIGPNGKKLPVTTVGVKRSPSQRFRGNSGNQD